MHRYKVVLLIATAIFICTFLQAQHAWTWASKGGSTGDDYGQGVCTDAQGNIYQIGYFVGIATFGPLSITSGGGFDIFVARAGSDGVWHWAVKAGGSSNNYGRAITLDGDGNIIITGEFTGSVTFGTHSLSGTGGSNVFVAKLDPYGNWLWATRAGHNGNASGNSIATDSQNNIYVTGAFTYQAYFGSTLLYAGSGGYNDIFLAKLNSAGSNWLWAVQAGGNSNDYGYGVALDEYDNVYITGSFMGYANFGGSYYMTSQGYMDAFVCRLNSSGNWIWRRSAGQTNYVYSKAIAIRNFNIVIGGYFNGTAIFGGQQIQSTGNYDAFAAHLTTDGNWFWAIRAGGSGNDYITSVTFGEDDFFYVCGYFSGTTYIGYDSYVSRGYNDAFLARGYLYGSGGWAQSARAGGGSEDIAEGIAVGIGGYIYVSGSFYGTCGFDPLSLVSSGNRDIFLAKFDSFFPPDPVINLFPADGATNLPRTVTISWRYITGINPAPSVFKIYMNDSYINQVSYNGDRVYDFQFPNRSYGSTVSWKIIPANYWVDCPNPVQWTYTVMSQPPDDEIPGLPTQAVYSEWTNYSGYGPIGVNMPYINLGWGNITPSFSFQTSVPVSNHTYSAVLMDKSINPMPNPTACLANFKLNLPQGIQTQVRFFIYGTVLPNELVYWDGTRWNDITASSGAVFNQYANVEISFSFTSSGRGVEEFAVNQGDESTLPVELSAFTAVPTQQNYVMLNWVTQSETNLLGFRLYRNSEENIADAIGLNVLIPSTNTSTEQQYTYLDEEVMEIGTYYYWLEALDLDGHIQMFGPVSATVTSQPEGPVVPPVIESAFLSIFPNPFNPMLFIKANHKADGMFAVSIYDMMGRKVITLQEEHSAKGMKSLTWNGKDALGRDCASGIYFIRCQSGKEIKTQKAILLK